MLALANFRQFQKGRCAELESFLRQNRSLESTLSILLTCTPLGNANASVLQHKHSNPPGSGTLINQGFEYHGLFL